MYYGNNIWIPVAVIAIVAMVIKTWIRAHYGINGPFDRKRGWDPNAENAHVPPMFNKMLEKAMAERDAELQKLRERVEVLERIATDGRKSHDLADEIERLRDQK